MLPIIDRVGRRQLLLIGSVTCMAVHAIIAAVMATKGHPVPNVNGNANLTWEIKGGAGKAVIAFSYIFTAIYGFTWVWKNSHALFLHYNKLTDHNRLPLHGSTRPKSSP